MHNLQRITPFKGYKTVSTYEAKLNFQINNLNKLIKNSSDILVEPYITIYNITLQQVLNANITPIRTLHLNDLQRVVNAFIKHLTNTIKVDMKLRVDAKVVELELLKPEIAKYGDLNDPSTDDYNDEVLAITSSVKNIYNLSTLNSLISVYTRYLNHVKK